MPRLISALIAVALWPVGEGLAGFLPSQAAAPETVDVCALQAGPSAHDHKLIDIRGVVSHGFESFTLSEPRCAASAGVWLEHGGRRRSDRVFCCATEPGTPRERPLVIEGVTTRLIEDALFRRFDARVRSRGDVTFRARLLGRFFAGVKQETRGGDTRGGYGHLGCCSLLVIQQVLAVHADRR